MYTRNQVNQLHEGSVARCTSITFFLDIMDHFHRWRRVLCACGASCLEVSCLINGRDERPPTAVALRAASCRLMSSVPCHRSRSGRAKEGRKNENTTPQTYQISNASFGFDGIFRYVIRIFILYSQLDHSILKT